jgi:predicted ester cyclase
MIVFVMGASAWAQDSDASSTMNDDMAAAFDFGFHLFNTLETDGIEDHVSEDWVLHDPANHGYAGRDGFIAWASSFHAPMPDFNVQHMDPLLANDEYLMFRWEFTGTHTAEVPGIPPTGNEVYLTGQIMHHIVDGQFVETWLAFDQMALLMQLGVLEPPQ